MKVPINQKFMLTITEASEYFGTVPYKRTSGKME